MNTNIDIKNFRINPPRIAKNKKKLIGIAAILIVGVILLNIFFNLKNREQVEVIKDELTLFLENLMIREGGLFTLLGSKPMTLFDITETLYIQEEDLEKEYEASKAFLVKCHQDPEHFHSDNMILPPYSEFREKCLRQARALHFQDHKKLWENWLNEKGLIETPLYKVTSREGVGGLFINIPNTIYILKKYYQDFSDLTGMDFDLNTILDVIEDPGSTFWQTVFKNHYLFGLVMGYGQKNSYLFDWTQKNSALLKTVSSSRFKEFSQIHQTIHLTRKLQVGINDLQIPYFASFEIVNEDCERYSRERDHIVNFLSQKDLIPFILNQLHAKRSSKITS